MSGDGKFAIITGASRGIGYAAAGALAAAGYDLLLIARDKKSLAGAAANIAQASPSRRIEPVAVDVADGAGTDRAIGSAIATHGAPDVMVHVAGVFRKGTLDASADDLAASLETNVVGAFHVLKAVMPAMRARGAGHVFSISSIAAKAGYPGFGVYAASKFALHGLMDSLYKELIGAGVSATSICPNWVATDFARQAGGEFASELMIQPEDIAKTILYALSLSPGAAIREILIDCRTHPY